MKQRTRSKRSISGFTLLELLVVIIVIGVLFAIAAPGWDTILSRQRVSTAREQIAQTLSVAQGDAKRTHSARIVVFDANSGKPRVATGPYVTSTALPTNTATLPTLSTWVLLNGSSGDAATNPGLLKLATYGPTGTTQPIAIVFDSNGAIAQYPTVPANQILPFVITVSRGGVTTRATDQCIVVETLLGAFHTESGAFNASTSKGCYP